MQDFHYQNGTKIIFGRETEASVGQELKNIQTRCYCIMEAVQLRKLGFMTK